MILFFYRVNLFALFYLIILTKLLKLSHLQMNQIERHIQSSDGTEYILCIPYRADNDSSRLKLYNKYSASRVDSLKEFTVYRFIRATTNGM